MLWLWLGCAEPFEHDASDLIEARIATVSLQDGLMIWSGSGLYHNEEPEIYWYDDQGNEISQGQNIPQGEGLLFVSVYVEGREMQTEIDLGRDLVKLQTKSSVYTADLNNIDISSRADENTQDLQDFLAQNNVLGEEHVWRIELLDTSERRSTRWFTPLEKGTSLPLSQYSTDVYPFDLQFDDGELISSKNTNLEAVLLSVSQLSDTNQTSVGWKWIGVPREEGIFIQERWLISDADVQEGNWYQATVSQSDDIWGISLVDVVEIENFEIAMLGDYQDDLDCFENGTLNFDWVASGRCSLQDIVGAKVVFEP